MKESNLQSFYEKVYHSYNTNDSIQFDSYERNQLLPKIYQQGNGKRILDLGAGRGIVSKFFQNLGYEVFAIEWTESGIKKLQELNINAQQHNIENIPYPYTDNFFDEVFWGDNIEHLFFPELVAKEIYRILKPGGRLVLSTPNYGWIVNRLYYLIMGLPRRTEGQKLPIWEWQHIRYFNKKQIKKFLQHSGFHKNFVFHAAERRQPFAFLSQFFPSLCGSVMVIEIHKENP